MSRTAHKLLAASGGEDAYEIDQSLMCSSGDASKLRRTPSSEGNRKTFTFSTWCKRSKLGLSAGGSNFHFLMGAFVSVGSPDDSHYFAFGFFHTDELVVGGWATNWRITNRLFRDTAAWMHLVLQVDTTQGTAANRIKIYVNGVEETSFGTNNNPSENYDLAINNTVPQAISDVAYDSGTGPYHFDGYMAETHFFDGAVVAPSEFGETDSDTGQWIPKKYVGSTSYGTNGYYMKFVSGAIGTDSSGEGNNYTATNLANADVVLDTPTNNFAVFNPLYAQLTPATLTQGNLFSTSAYGSGVTGNSWNRSTFLIESGAFYIEFLIKDVDEGIVAAQINYSPTTDNIDNQTYSQYTANTGVIDINGSAISYGSGNVTSTDGDIIGIAIDRDNNYFSVYKNGSALSTNNTISGGSIIVGVFNSNHGGEIIANFGQNGTFCGEKTAQGNSDGSGIGNFYYSVPSGYKALCTKNLSTSTIKLSTDHFNTVLYTGNDTTNNITGVGFQPDLVWLKNRSQAADYMLHDAVRGADNGIRSNNNVAESDQSANFTGFASDGFSLASSSNRYNDNSENYVSWNWKANGSGSSDSSKDITATVSANTSSGFSIVTYTAPSSDGTQTVPHGLGVTPKAVVYKARSTTGNWTMLHTLVDGSVDYLKLNDADSNGNTSYSLTSSTIPCFESSSQTMVAYAFAEIEGFSKFGSYSGNGSTNGPYIYTGFRPAWIMIKRTDVQNYWWGLFDNKRDPINVADAILYANDTYAEDDSDSLDILSNGFKLKANSAFINNSSGSYIYMAFAESPFKYANAR